MPYADWALLGGITLLASTAQSATGFGFAIIAVPLYLLVLNSLAAVQVAILVTPVISLVVVPRLLPALQRGLLARIVAGTMLGLPLGMVVYAQAGLFWIKVAVGVLITLFALLFFLAERLPALGIGSGGAGTADGGRPGAGAGRPGLGAVAVGLVSGTMTTSLGMPGPVLVLYFSRLALEMNAVRATIMSSFLLSYGGAMIVQAATVGIAGDIWRLAAVLAPFALAGGVAGHRVSRGMSQVAFRRITLLLLLGTGLYMLYATLAPG